MTQIQRRDLTFFNFCNICFLLKISFQHGYILTACFAEILIIFKKIKMQHYTKKCFEVYAKSYCKLGIIYSCPTGPLFQYRVEFLQALRRERENRRESSLNKSLNLKGKLHEDLNLNKTIKNQQHMEIFFEDSFISYKMYEQQVYSDCISS